MRIIYFSAGHSGAGLGTAWQTIETLSAQKQEKPFREFLRLTNDSQLI